jgi:hypothetical protein
MYRRVPVPAFTGGTVVLVWLYVGDEIIKRSLAPPGKARNFDWLTPDKRGINLEKLLDIRHLMI